MIQYADPFERILSFVWKRWRISVQVRFVHPSEIKTRIGFLRWRTPPGEILFPTKEGDPPLISLDGTLHGGVEKTLDVLAHELAHLIVGVKEGHSPNWEAAYEEIAEALLEDSASLRKIGEKT